MPSREERIRERLFPGVDTFDRRAGGFTTLPLVLRRAQFIFPSPRHWQVYTYVLMRTGPAGVAWFTLSEMAYDLQFRSVPKLKPYVDDLVSAGWLRREKSKGQDYYIAPDPLQVLKRLVGAGKIPGDRLEDIDDLLESLGQAPLGRSAALKAAGPASTAAGEDE